MKRFFVILTVFLCACSGQNDTGKTDTLSSIDSNAANTSSTAQDEIFIQSFNQLPSMINNCSALFVQDSNATDQYVFATDLKGTAFIKLNGRFMELKLVRQTNIDKYTVNELYVNDEVEVDLKIKQLADNSIPNSWNYSGVLVVRRDGKRAVTDISGKLGC
jgi:hypothetical protein